MEDSTIRIRKKSATQQTIKPKIFYKNNRGFRHDLFKCELEDFSKNVSWQKGIVDIKKVEHVHFFHSHNSQGVVQKYSNAVGAHFHEIKTWVSEDGEMKAECGPPLRKVLKRLKNNLMKSVIENVSWSDSDDGIVLDNHKHKVTYLGSENIDPMKIKQIQQENYESVKSMSYESRSGDPGDEMEDISE